MLIVIAILLAMILLSILNRELAAKVILLSVMGLIALVAIGIFAGIGVYAYNYYNDWFNVACLAAVFIVGTGVIIGALEA